MSTRLFASLALAHVLGCSTPGTSSSTADAGHAPACAMFTEPDACAQAGCGMWHQTSVSTTGDGCRALRGPALCMEVEGTPSSAKRSFWQAADGGVVLVTQGCDGMAPSSPAAAPRGYTECTGATGEPAECQCLCANGLCGGERTRALMDACSFTTPCATYNLNVGETDQSAVVQCMLQALQTGAPASLRLSGNFGDFIRAESIYLLGGGHAVRLRQSEDIILVGHCVSSSAPQRCTLKASTFFEACRSAADGGAATCMDPDTWFTACAAGAPGCTP